jgi:hypothetical protein
MFGRSMNPACGGAPEIGGDLFYRQPIGTLEPRDRPRDDGQNKYSARLCLRCQTITGGALFASVSETRPCEHARNTAFLDFFMNSATGMTASCSRVETDATPTCHTTITK